MGKPKDGGRGLNTGEMNFDLPIRLIGLKSEANKQMSDGGIHLRDDVWLRETGSGVVATTPLVVDANVVFTQEEMAERERMHAKRVRGRDKRNVRAQCWCCGKLCKNKSYPKSEGWKTRPMPGNGSVVECFCPMCFKEYGWGDELANDVMKRMNRSRKTVGARKSKSKSKSKSKR